ncbi:EAL domain-containing protein [Mycoplasma marinum]
MYNLFMKIFVNSVTLTLFLMIYCLLYFIIERWKKSDLIVRKNYPKLILNFIEGNIYSIFGLLFQLFLFQTKQFAQPYIYIILALTLVFLRNAVIACYALIGPMIYSMFAYPLDDIFYYVISIMFISMILTSFMKNFIKSKISILVNVFFIMINILVLWLVASLALDYKIDIQFVLATLLPFLLSIILILLIAFLLRFLRSANLLYESSTYDTFHFYRESIFEKMIREGITLNKVSKGLFVIFEFNWKNTDENNYKVCKKEALKKIETSMGEKSILFKASKRSYGLFTPINANLNLKESLLNNRSLKRKEGDVVKVIEKLITSINGEYDVDGFKNKLNARAGITIYGVQEQNIDKMISFSEFALESSKWNTGWNNSIVFDPILYKEKASDYIAITEMDKTIGITSISNTFLPIYDLKKKKTAMNVANPITTDVLDVEYDSLLKHSEYMGYKSILLSFNAAQALKASNGWNRSSISVDYSLDKIMDPNFKVENFFASVKRFNQTKSRVILNFDYKEIINFEINELSKKMKILREHGIRYGVFNFLIDEHLNKLAKMKPEFIFLDESLYKTFFLSKTNLNLIKEIVAFAKVIKSRVVVSQVEKQRELSFILKTEINYIGGPFFNEGKIEPLLFNKKK